MYSIFQFLFLPCCASHNFTQKPWFRFSALTALFPFFCFFSLDIIIFYMCYTYFSIFALILCSFYSLLSGFRSSKFLSFFINQTSKSYYKRDKKEFFACLWNLSENQGPQRFRKPRHPDLAWWIHKWQLCLQDTYRTSLSNDSWHRLPGLVNWLSGVIWASYRHTGS